MIRQLKVLFIKAITYMDCKVISLQLIKINEKKNLYGKITMIKCYMKKVWYVYGQGWNSRKLKSICVKHEESGVSLFPAFYIFHTVTIIITMMIIMEEGRLIYSCPVLLLPLC